MATFAGTSTGSTPGVSSTTSGGTTANAIQGNSTSGYAAIYGTTSGGGSAGLYGSTSGVGGYGVYGDAGTQGYYGVYGQGLTGVTGSGTAQYGTGGSFAGGAIGVYVSGGYHYGVNVVGNGAQYGIYIDYNVSGYAGYFNAAVYVGGALTKPGGSFLIDHPLDPANKLLQHSFVESPERKNIYDGIGVADQSGEVEVQLPTYFDALNMDVRYQLTAVGAPSILFIKTELKDGRFVIGGAQPGQKTCWQVTGNRCDAWAQANPLTVEQDKPLDERGLYLQPAAHGFPPEKGVDTKRHPSRPQAPQQPPLKSP